ncbi:transposase (plasmid) [Paracoccus aminophilus JCM 7686]|uniref:Transposase n=1 Tax=Paracoccus aminophilus JCM 7686 TaxID=1367847 RepID=S5YHW6_PARAH|nr:transposase [Paracoccus aminophilus JCM 7686]
MRPLPFGGFVALFFLQTDSGLRVSRLHDLSAPASDQAYSAKPIERLNKEAKRRADVVGIFPSEASIMRLIGAVLELLLVSWTRR